MQSDEGAATYRGRMQGLIDAYKIQLDVPHNICCANSYREGIEAYKKAIQREMEHIKNTLA